MEESQLRILAIPAILAILAMQLGLSISPGCCVDRMDHDSRVWSSLSEEDMRRIDADHIGWTFLALLVPEENLWDISD